MEPGTRNQNSDAYANWQATVNQRHSLPYSEHGGVANPVLRDQLMAQAQELLKEINIDTHYQGEPVPSL